MLGDNTLWGTDASESGGGIITITASGTVTLTGDSNGYSVVIASATDIFIEDGTKIVVSDSADGADGRHALTVPDGATIMGGGAGITIMGGKGGEGAPGAPGVPGVPGSPGGPGSNGGDGIFAQGSVTISGTITGNITGDAAATFTITIGSADPVNPPNPSAPTAPDDPGDSDSPYDLVDPAISAVSATPRGMGARLAVSAASGPFSQTFQWQMNQANGTWANIHGAMGAAFDWENLTPGMTYTVRCIVRNSDGGYAVSREISFTIARQCMGLVTGSNVNLRQAVQRGEQRSDIQRKAGQLCRDEFTLGQAFIRSAANETEEQAI